MQNNKSISILDLTSTEACDFFLKSSSYCNLELPEYINFSGVLKWYSEKLSSNELKGKTLDEIKDKNPGDLEGVNYTILANKDGGLLWRPITFINPALYVWLVLDITKEENWKTIKEMFGKFQGNENLKSAGIPRKSIKPLKEKSSCDKGAQIQCWLRDVEQESIKLSLEYKYIFKTDITNCYGAIYTHSIPWALHGKDDAKGNRNHEGPLGNRIDKYIRCMNYGQTNGIPQGAVLMDFIAEIVLGYADLELLKEIKEIKEYKIIRYRDDYRIFVNNSEDGDKILKFLSDVLRGLGMSLSKEKTHSFDEVIHNSVKKCKLHMLNIPFGKDFQKELLSIYELTLIYPNDGSIKTMLVNFHKKLEKSKKRKLRNIESLISIVINIAYKNPKFYDICMAIFSFFLQGLEENKKCDVVEKVINRFKEIPNHGCLDLWLQRIILKVDEESDKTEEKLCELIRSIKKKQLKDDNFLWNMNWLKEEYKLRTEVYETIFDKNIFDERLPIISSKEINVFDYYF